MKNKHFFFCEKNIFIYFSKIYNSHFSADHKVPMILDKLFLHRSFCACWFYGRRAGFSHVNARWNPAFLIPYYYMLAYLIGMAIQNGGFIRATELARRRFVWKAKPFFVLFLTKNLMDNLCKNYWIIRF